MWFSIKTWRKYLIHTFYIPLIGVGTMPRKFGQLIDICLIFSTTDRPHVSDVTQRYSSNAVFSNMCVFHLFRNT